MNAYVVTAEHIRTALENLRQWNQLTGPGSPDDLIELGAIRALTELLKVAEA